MSIETSYSFFSISLKYMALTKFNRESRQGSLLIFWILCQNKWLGPIRGMHVWHGPGPMGGTGIPLKFIQYFACNWPRYSLRGLHTRITWFSLYGIRIPLFSLYGIHMPLFPYMVILPIVLAVALLWTAMDSPLSQGLLLWRHNDMTWPLLFRGIRAEVSETPDNALTKRMHGDYRLILVDSLYDSTQFVTHFCEITLYILRDAIVG